MNAFAILSLLSSVAVSNVVAQNTTMMPNTTTSAPVFADLTSQISGATGQLYTVLSSLMSQVQTLNSQVSAQQAQISSMNTAILSGSIIAAPVQTVAFSAAVNVTTPTYFTGALGGKVIFDRVVYNIPAPGGYNKTNGVYTCPVNGTYYFHMSILNSYNKNIIVCIMKNGACLASTYSSMVQWYQGANAITVWCNAGDMVYAQITGGTTPLYVFGTDGVDFFSTFTGYRVGM